METFISALAFYDSTNSVVEIPYARIYVTYLNIFVRNAKEDV